MGYLFYAKLIIKCKFKKSSKTDKIVWLLNGYPPVTLNRIVARKPASVDKPVTEPPVIKALGSIVSAIMVSIAPAIRGLFFNKTSGAFYQ
jgi:hypothetical protein